MEAARILSQARRAAGLSQRQLAARAGMPQSTVARIEGGRLSPRVNTLERLLRAAGHELVNEPRRGADEDRSLIRDRLGLTPAERARLAVAEARAAARLVPRPARR